MTAAALLLQAANNVTGLTPDQEFQIAQEAIRQHRGLAGLEDILVPFMFFATVVIIAWFGWQRRRAQIQAAAELRKQLLEKFDSGKELAEFLEGTAGRQFLLLTAGRGYQGWAGGIVLTMLGLGFLGLAATGQHRMIVPGVFLLAVGLGLLISAYIAHRMQTNGSTTPSSSQPGVPGQL